MLLQTLIEWIFYKKSDQWYIEWQGVRTSDNKWYNEWQRITKSDKNHNEWYNECQRVTTNDSECQQMKISDSEWQQVVKLMKTVEYTLKNGWLPFFLWLLKGIDGYN